MLRSLFFAFALFSPLAATVGFTPFYSPTTQCGPFTVNWGASNVTTGPPFILLILPFDAPAAILKLPDSSFDATTKTGKYTLDKLPLKSGAQFVVTMDDGYGRGTGGVSLIQTVGSSSDASCLTADVSSMSSFFTLNPAIPSQCSPQTVSWNSTRYREPPDIRGLIPGGQSFTLDRPTSNSTTQTAWDVHIREGTQLLFLVQPAASIQNTSGDGDARTGPLITVTGKSSLGDTCLDTNSPSSTVVSAATASIPIFPGTTDPSGNVKVAAITGGIIGGLGLIAIICASTFLYRSFTRKRRFGGSSYDTRSQPRSRTFNSSKNGVPSTNVERSLAGITIASTQISGFAQTASIGRNAAHPRNRVNEFGASLGDHNGTRGNSSTHTVPPSTLVFATPMHKPSLNMQGRAENPQPPQQPPRSTVSPSPIVSSTDGALLHQWEDTNTAYGVDEKRTDLGDVLTQYRSGLSRDEHDRNSEREPERQAWTAHPYANPLASVNPSPTPTRRSPAWSTSSPVPLPSISVRGDDDDDGDGNQAVSEEYAFASRRGLSMRARMGGAGGVYGSRETRGRENEIGTEYVRHTDAGAVRVVELPPLYDNLRR